MVFRQHVSSIITLTIIYNFSVLIILNFNFIQSVKVLGHSDRLPESIIDNINTLRMYITCEDYVRDEHFIF